jgi:hypothetical protein
LFCRCRDYQFSTMWLNWTQKSLPANAVAEARVCLSPRWCSIVTLSGGLSITTNLQTNSKYTNHTSHYLKLHTACSNSVTYGTGSERRPRTDCHPCNHLAFLLIPTIDGRAPPVASHSNLVVWNTLYKKDNDQGPTLRHMSISNARKELYSKKILLQRMSFLYRNY